jgi:hypothetical protein
MISQFEKYFAGKNEQIIVCRSAIIACYTLEESRAVIVSHRYGKNYRP